MGTRGLLGLIIKGVRHGQYNQYDCYPQGLGQGIVNFLLTLTPEEIAEMANLVEDIEVSSICHIKQESTANFTISHRSMFHRQAFRPPAFRFPSTRSCGWNL